MDSELARGRVSKFYWWVAIRSRAWIQVYLRFFQDSGFKFTLRIVRLNTPQIFYRFGFPRLSYRCVIYFSTALLDMIYLC